MYDPIPPLFVLRPILHSPVILSVANDQRLATNDQSDRSIPLVTKGLDTTVSHLGKASFHLYTVADTMEFLRRGAVRC